jgi:hypothetical protein
MKNDYEDTKPKHESPKGKELPKRDASAIFFRKENIHGIKKLIAKALFSEAEELEKQRQLISALVELIGHLNSYSVYSLFEENAKDVIRQMTPETKRHATHELTTLLELVLEKDCTPYRERAAALLLAEGINTGSTSFPGRFGASSGMTPLMIAVKCRNLEIAERIIKGEFPLVRFAWTDQDGCDESALHYAVRTGEVAIVKRLIELGHPDPMPTRRAPSILHYTVRCHLAHHIAVAIAMLLVEKGYGLNWTHGPEGFSTYQAAVMRHMHSVAEAIRNHPNYCRTIRCRINHTYPPMSDEEFERAFQTDKNLEKLYAPLVFI